MYSCARRTRRPPAHPRRLSSPSRRRSPVPCRTTRTSRRSRTSTRPSTARTTRSARSARLRARWRRWRRTWSVGARTATAQRAARWKCCMCATVRRARTRASSLQARHTRARCARSSPRCVRRKSLTRTVGRARGGGLPPACARRPRQRERLAPWPARAPCTPLPLPSSAPPLTCRLGLLRRADAEPGWICVLVEHGSALVCALSYRGL
jgi:hypothetical protein